MQSKAQGVRRDAQFLVHTVCGKKLAKQFGVPFRMGFTSRQTIVIDAEGRIKKLYRDVDVSTHATDVLKDVG